MVAAVRIILVMLKSLPSTETCPRWANEVVLSEAVATQRIFPACINTAHPDRCVQRERQVSWLMDIVLQPSQIALLLSSGKLGDDPYTVAGTAMASGSHFSPCPYSLIKAWGFAP